MYEISARWLANCHIFGAVVHRRFHCLMKYCLKYWFKVILRKNFQSTLKTWKVNVLCHEPLLGPLFVCCTWLLLLDFNINKQMPDPISILTGIKPIFSSLYCESWINSWILLIHVFVLYVERMEITKKNLKPLTLGYSCKC